MSLSSLIHLFEVCHEALAVAEHIERHSRLAAYAVLDIYAVLVIDIGLT